MTRTSASASASVPVADAVCVAVVVPVTAPDVPKVVLPVLMSRPNELVSVPVSAD